MMKRRILSACLCVAALTLPLSAAQANPEDMIKYRKNVMKAIGGHTGAMFAVARGQAGDASHMEGHVRGLAASSMMVKDLFPPESELGDTRAKAEIWSDAEGFAAAVKELEDAATGLLAAFESNGDMGEAMKAIGQSCKGCHDDYRSDD